MEKRIMIIRHSLSILFVSTFALFATLFIFMPSHSQMAGALSFLGKIDSLAFVGVSKDLCLEVNYPVSDEVGHLTSAYEFQVMNQGMEEQDYQISFFTGNDTDSLAQNTIHYVIQKDGSDFSSVYTLPEDGVIVTSSISGGSTESFAIKFWVHDENDLSIQGKTFQGIMSLDVLK